MSASQAPQSSALPGGVHEVRCALPIELAQRGELDPSFLTTHRFLLEEGPRAYEMFKKKQDGLVRAVFEP